MASDPVLCMHRGRWLWLVFAWAAVAAVQSAPLAGSRRLIGILELPRLVTRVGPVVLRGRPSSASPVVATISSLEALEIREFESERSGALVFAREGNWSLLKTSAGVAGWLAPADAGTFHSLESLLRHGLSYLTQAWDGRLGTSPGTVNRPRVPSDPRKRMIGYLVSKPERARLERDRWILVFERPDPFATVVARFQSPRYDHVLRGTAAKTPPDIVVFDRQPGWFQVALYRDAWRREPRVWIQDAPVWRFHEITSESQRDRLTEEVWGREHDTVRVVGSRDVAGVLWLDIEIVSHSICTSNAPPTVTARGWIPAHAPSGEPMVWFAARGC